MTTTADLSAAAFVQRTASLKKLLERLTTHRSGNLAETDAFDAQVLDNAIRAELLEMETVRDWKRNPVNYLGYSAGSIDLLMKRSFASPAERLKLVIGRLKATPAIFEAMKANVENPPKEFTDLGIIVAKGSVSFFKSDLAVWAKMAAGKDEKLLAEFEAANKPVTSLKCLRRLAKLAGKPISLPKS